MTFVRIDSYQQVQSRADFARRLEWGYATGTAADNPRTLYLDPQTGGTVLGPAVIVELLDDPIGETRMARAELHGDDSHRNGCASGAYRRFERDSCGTCALLGWEAHDENGHPQPNSAGWPLVYLAAREPIPAAWLPALHAALNDDENDRYRDNVRRRVATYGVKVTDERPGYRLPVPTPEKLHAYLNERHEDDQRAVVEDAYTIAEDRDVDYTRADSRAAQRLYDRLTAPAAAE